MLPGLGSSTDGWIESDSELAEALDAPSASPIRLIRNTGGYTFALLEGLEDSAEIINADPRVHSSALFKSTSTFAKADDPSRGALLWKANGLNPWWSRQRTLDDFDNVRYSCITATCSGNITLTRLSDDKIVARFTYPKLSRNILGIVQVLEPVSEELLDLIFCAMYVKRKLTSPSSL
ncbi:hypothetical protein FRC01_008692 [Tulasnella sp. 417]|nr:hypothetical protein FRC01_008692 [Tulasnella sp. 417]